MYVTCPCGYDENTTIKRPVPGFTNVYEVGIQCPECDEFTHCFFFNDRLSILRQQMDKVAFVAREHPNNNYMVKLSKQRQRLFTKKFAKFQAMMCKRVGIERPKGDKDAVIGIFR